MAAVVTVGPWAPLYQGVEIANGQQQAQLAGERNHQVLCLRIDLSDPSVKLFTTPKCTNCGSFETVAENTSHFLEQYGVQAAVNGGFYQSSSGPNDVPLGTPEDVLGMAISEGIVVSPASTSLHAATFLFTSNNVPIFIPNNFPGTNAAGIYTAISGNLALLVNGTNVQSPNPSDLDPRTAFGLSEDLRYLFLMTIDGRQPGWSDGADFFNTGEWLKRFGAHHGINVDGGGSTTMVMADCDGKGVRLNRSSFVAAYGRERIIGHNFGVRALPLQGDLKNLAVNPDNTTAVVTWETDFPATTQVQYGRTTNYGNATPLDSRLTHRHVATISGLQQGTNYFFRAISTDSQGGPFTASCRFSTLSSLITTQRFGLTQSWSFTTNNLDGVNWKAISYTEPGWLGQGPGLLYVIENNATVAPKSTVLPPLSATAIPRTYYFRTHFNFSGSAAGISLVFSNFIDDGAVFYLNGAELARVRMPPSPTVITNASTPTATPCVGTAQAGDAATICPDVFVISGNLLTNLVQGDNVIAVEVHNLTGTDLVFGSALIQATPIVTSPSLGVWMEDNLATLFWNGDGFTLQRSTDLNSSTNWSDVPGPVTGSPFTVTNEPSFFYRLRN